MSEKKVETRTPSSVSWEAQEYVPYDKNVGWFVGLIIVGVALVAFSVFLGWWSFTLLIVVSVVALIVYAVRPPRVIKYTLNSKTLKEGDREYRFEDFKSFGVLNEGNNYAIVLTPRKRLLPRVRVYFPSEKGEGIVDIFGSKMPMTEVKLDVLDKIVKFLRI